VETALAHIQIGAERAGSTERSPFDLFHNCHDTWRRQRAARDGFVPDRALELESAPGFCLDAFSSREPVSTSLENALNNQERTISPPNR
jgi:hypothetical protein